MNFKSTVLLMWKKATSFYNKNKKKLNTYNYVDNMLITN